MHDSNYQLSEFLIKRLNSLLENLPEEGRAIMLDLLWKATRRDYHGVADCAMDMRELRL